MGSTMTLPVDFDVLAPDGSEVRVLLSLTGGSMAHFRLPPGQVSRAVRHRTVEEIWYILSGLGEMWRADEGVVRLRAGVCLTIPAGVAFQFRALGAKPLGAKPLGAKAPRAESLGDEALAAVAVTMPPWPGQHEAQPAAGIWEATVD